MHYSKLLETVRIAPRKSLALSFITLTALLLNAIVIAITIGVFSLSFFCAALLYILSLSSSFRFTPLFFLQKKLSHTSYVLSWILLIVQLFCFILLLRSIPQLFFVKLIMILIVFAASDLKFEFLSNKTKYWIFLIITLLATFCTNTTNSQQQILIFITTTGTILFNHFMLQTYKQMQKQTTSLEKMSTQLADVSTKLERTRIQHELHDTVGHELTALNIHLNLLEQEAIPYTSTLEISTIRQRILLINQLVRDVINNQQTQQQLSLQEIIAFLIERLPRVTCQLDLSSTAIYVDEKPQRIITQGMMECLTNCLKHSEATEIKISMTIDDLHNLHITIANDNILVEQDFTDVSSSLGLQIFKDNLQSCNGNLKVHLCDDLFEVRITLPYSPNASLEAVASNI